MLFLCLVQNVVLRYAIIIPCDTTITSGSAFLTLWIGSDVHKDPPALMGVSELCLAFGIGEWRVES
jgi:hypothetical protein